MTIDTTAKPAEILAEIEQLRRQPESKERDATIEALRQWLVEII